MNWKRLICWLKGHRWQVSEGKRHCTCCGYRPNDDSVRFCPKCGSERLRSCLMVSAGYQYTKCIECGHNFQDTSEFIVTVIFSHGHYELEKPKVNQDGTLIMETEEG